MARAGTQTIRTIVFLVLAGSGCHALFAQTSVPASLPDAPKASLLAQSNMPQSLSEAPESQAPVPATPGEHPRLTRTDAEQMAIKNNPRVSVGRLVAIAQHQMVRETRAAELPTILGSVTAEDAEQAS